MLRVLPGALLALAIGAPCALPAQRVTWETVATFYGDNTEFFTPYRVGETIFGGQALTRLRLVTSDRTELLVGGFGDLRWGSAEFLDEVKPILSFRYRSGGSTGVLGTLVTERRHGLLDALAVSTLELTRPVEYGAQWLERRRAWDLDLFVDWQALNTPEQREAFDAGAVVRVRPAGPLTLEAQYRWLHRGGQLFDAGQSVANNHAGAVGLGLGDTLPVLGLVTLRVYRLWSRGTLHPDPPPARPGSGRGTLVRLGAAPRPDLEVFGLYWRGRDFGAGEGDPNYGSRGADPAFYRSRREYLELGAARRGALDGPVTLDLEFRLHRIDDEPSVALFDSGWEYSYRLVVRAPFTLSLHR